MPGGADAEKQRLDKWLWHVRFSASRTRSAEFVRLGFVRLNGVRITDPAKTVRRGDVLTLALAHQTRVVRIERILPGRAGPEHAALAFEDLSSNGASIPAEQPR